MGKLGAQEIQAALAVTDGHAQPGEPADVIAEAAGHVATPEEPVAEEQAAESTEAQAEAPKEAPKEAKAEKDEAPEEQKGRFSKQWALLQKETREIQRQKAEFKRMREEFDASKSEIENMRRLMMEDPAAYVQKHGGKEFIHRLTKAYGGEVDPKSEIGTLKEELTSIRQELAQQREEEKRLAEQRQVESYVNEYRGNLSAELSKDDYDLVSIMDSDGSETLQLASIYARDFQQTLTPAEAAAKMQEELRAEYLPRIAKTRSLLEHFRENPDDFEAIAKELGFNAAKQRGNSVSKPQTETVNNSMNGNSPAGFDDTKILDRKGEVQRALALLS